MSSRDIDELNERQRHGLEELEFEGSRCPHCKRLQKDGSVNHDPDCRALDQSLDSILGDGMKEGDHRYLLVGADAYDGEDEPRHPLSSNPVYSPFGDETKE